MKEKLLAVYERKSTLWKNANAFYKMQDWTRMECKERDYTEEIQSIYDEGFKWIDRAGNDVTESEIKKRYRPFLITLINERKTNEKCFWFDTKEDANRFFVQVLHDKVFSNWKRVA